MNRTSGTCGQTSNKGTNREGGKTNASLWSCTYLFNQRFYARRKPFSSLLNKMSKIMCVKVTSQVNWLSIFVFNFMKVLSLQCQKRGPILEIRLMISSQSDLTFITIAQEIIVITIKPGTKSICWSSNSNNWTNFVECSLNDHLKNSIKQFKKKKNQKNQVIH